MTDRLQALADAGVSIWLDDLSRERIESGNLTDLVKDRHVVGVTTNPTIFAAALADGERYDDQVRRLAADGADVSKATFELTTEDVRNACDIMRPTYDATPKDGRVSIEVDPFLAHDTDGTVKSARDLWAAVDRPNVLVKIPATEAGIPAIRQATADGISVNVTLIFDTERYRKVMDAYLSGLEDAKERASTSPPSTRSRRSSSRASTPRSTSGSTPSARPTPTRCGVRPPSRTHAWPTRRTKRSSASDRFAGPARRRAPTPSARCGPRPA